MIDVLKLLGERNPALAARLPRGVGRLLQLVTHQGQINRLLRGYPGAAGGVGDPGGAGEDTLRFCRYILDYLQISTRVIGEEYLHSAARPVVCCNHPTGGIEGLVMVETLLRLRGSCLVPANDLLCLVAPLAPVLVPVNRAAPSRSAATAFMDAFAGDEAVLVFPAGVTARIRAGVLREYPWESAFVSRARRAGRELLPVRVSGRNSHHFYLIHRIRRALGIHFNLEMALLVDEMARRRGDTVVVEFLPPRLATIGTTSGTTGSTTGSTRDADRRLAAQIRREVEQAGEGGVT